MKLIPLLIGFTIIQFSCWSQTNDPLQNIKQTLNNYIQGGNDGDTVLLFSGFHSSAQLKTFNKKSNTFRILTLEQFKAILRPNAGKKQKRLSEIESIKVHGNAANAVIKIETPSVIVYDFMNLLEVGNQWFIVDKVTYFQDK